MDNNNTSESLQAGVTYAFTLADGRKRKVILKGLRTSQAGEVFKIDVDGVQGEYPDLKTAIGGDYIQVTQS